MDEHILINNLTKIEHLRSIVRQDLRDTGVKLPKSKKLKKVNQSQNAPKGDLTSIHVFGDHLCNLPSTFVEEHGHVPCFLVEASHVIESHLDSEGIFRKSGSVNRQKELRQAIEEGKGMADSNVYDVSSLVKQFFRELPEPLFSPVFHDAFIKCYQLPLEKAPTQAILQLCLCLPLENIGALRFLLHILSKVASHSDKNKMTASNLALVMAPNLMHSNKVLQKMNNSDERMLHTEVAIVEILINNCKYVGLVNSALCQQAALMSECFGTDDDLDASDDNTLEDSSNVLRKKKRKRSGSLTGFVNSIASGIAKLRRSTDGRSINMSSNSTLPSELSINSNVSQTVDNLTLDTSATPCVIRKRRASGDNVPFSTTKKKAILGNLPQKSILASTPFTPASTIKRNYHDDSCYGVRSETPRLNCTTPCAGSKTPRKKLNLFNSPGSNKKVKRQASVARMNSPNLREKSGKGKSIFRRLSGSREKIPQESCSNEHRVKGGSKKSDAGNVSPRSTVSDSALTCSSLALGRSNSSQSIQDSEFSVTSGGSASTVSLNKGFIHEVDVMNNHSRLADQDVSLACNGSRSRSADRVNVIELSAGSRSKSVDSPGLRRGQPNTLRNGLPKHKGLDKSIVSGPYPIIVPVVPNGFDVGENATPLRRSRRDEFEERKRQQMRESQECPQESAFNKSACSQLDESLMQAVLAPPHGFGDQTILDEDDFDKDQEVFRSHVKHEPSDKDSMTGFSTISGGTVLRRTDSGNYTKDSSQSLTLKNSVSSCMYSDRPLSTATSKDSVFSDSSSTCLDFVKEQDVLSNGGGRSVTKLDASKQMEDTFIDVCGGVEDVYVSLLPSETTEGEYVTLKRGTSFDKKDTARRDRDKKGMDLLRESYVSEEESSSGFYPTSQDFSSRGQSCNDEMKRVSSRPNIHRKKSISAEDLKSTPRVNLPVRSRSMYISPVKKFNYKPHLEISKETHRILARAGYIKDASDTDKPHGKDVQVPVKSPKRSSHREEMMQSLRSSFHERINSSRNWRKGNYGNQSTMSSLSSLDESQVFEQSQNSEEGDNANSDEGDVHRDNANSDEGDVHRDNANNGDESLLSGCEKLSLMSQNCSLDMTVDDNVGSGEENHVEQRQASAKAPQIGQSEVCNERKGVIDGTEISEEEDSIQAKEPLAVQEKKSEAVQEPESKRTNPQMKHVDKSMTLSGFLDQEIRYKNKGPLRIKGAELSIPRHDSVVNIQQQKAGLVADNVKQFNHNTKYGKLNTSKISTHRRGNSPIRIPTIFAKNEDKAKQYKEIAQFIRERTGQKNFMSLPQVPPTPKRQDSGDQSKRSESISSEEELSGSNKTVLVNNLNGDGSFGDIDKSLDQEGGTVVSDSDNSSFHVQPRLSESLQEKVDLLCTPSTGNKSPLHESTNTALTSLIGSCSVADNIRLRTAGGLTPHRIGFKNESLLSQRNNQRPAIKRLKGARSPRRVHQNRSPHRSGAASPLACANRMPSKEQARSETEEKTCLLTVPISLDDKSSPH